MNGHMSEISEGRENTFVDMDVHKQDLLERSFCNEPAEKNSNWGWLNCITYNIICKYIPQNLRTMEMLPFLFTYVRMIYVFVYMEWTAPATITFLQTLFYN